MIVSLVLSLAACKQEAPGPGQLAAVAAKGYYDLLLEGKYEDFVAGTHRPDSIPESYRAQLVLNARMFVEQQEAERRGMKKVDVISAKADSTGSVADVFLSVVYGDSTKEQIVVPMVHEKGKWLMR